MLPDLLFELNGSFHFLADNFTIPAEGNHYMADEGSANEFNSFVFYGRTLLSLKVHNMRWEVGTSTLKLKHLLYSYLVSYVLF